MNKPTSAPTRVCPQCKATYTPVLGERDPNDNRCIQDIYPNASPIEREQLQTGICSDECWDKFLGVGVSKPRHAEVTPEEEEYYSQCPECHKPDINCTC